MDFSADDTTRQGYAENGCAVAVEVAVFGLAFKPKADDVQEAPSIELIRYLADEGAYMRGFAPQAVKFARCAPSAAAEGRRRLYTD